MPTDNEVMEDNKIEAKLDVFRKLQDGITSVGFKIQHSDIPDYLAAAALGKRYYLVLMDADYYDESEGNIPNNSDSSFVTNSVTEQNLSNSTPLDNPVSKESLPTEKSEGEKVLALSHIRCNDKSFQEYVAELGWNELTPKDNATDYLYNFCDIVSRSELTTDVAAQKLFRELDQKFKDWQIEQRYKDNLNREY